MPRWGETITPGIRIIHLGGVTLTLVGNHHTEMTHIWHDKGWQMVLWNHLETIWWNPQQKTTACPSCRMLGDSDFAKTRRNKREKKTQNNNHEKQRQVLRLLASRSTSPPQTHIRLFEKAGTGREPYIYRCRRGNAQGRKKTYQIYMYRYICLYI